MSRITNAMLMEAINGINTKFDALSKRVEALEGKSKPTVSTKGNSKTAKAVSLNIADYEPKKKDGFYIWGRKTDTMKSGHYMAMRKAYCIAVATNGQFTDSSKAYDAKVKVDYSEGSAYSKAKAEFNAKFPYIKKADR